MGLRKKKSLVDQASDLAGGYVDTVRPHVEAALESARDFVQETALPALSDARDKSAPVLAGARDKAAPVFVSARDKAVSGILDAKDAAKPYVATGAGLAVEKATQARELADAKVSQLKGEKPKKSKLKRFVLIAGVAGGVAFLAKKLQGGGSTADNWQSSYTPSPAPTAAPTPAAPVEDSAGSSPDEALADAAESAHPVTTPDEPAEVVDVEPDTK